MTLRYKKEKPSQHNPWLNKRGDKRYQPTREKKRLFNFVNKQEFVSEKDLWTFGFPLDISRVRAQPFSIFLRDARPKFACIAR
jgi:hypothetical protein